MKLELIGYEQDDNGDSWALILDSDGGHHRHKIGSKTMDKQMRYLATVGQQEHRAIPLGRLASRAIIRQWRRSGWRPA